MESTLSFKLLCYFGESHTDSATCDTHMQNNVITKVQAMTRLNCQWLLKCTMKWCLKDYMLRAKYSKCRLGWSFTIGLKSDLQCEWQGEGWWKGKGDGRVEGGGVHESTKLCVVFLGGKLRLIYLFFSLPADYRCFGSLCFRHFQLWFSWAYTDWVPVNYKRFCYLLCLNIWYRGSIISILI